MCYELPLVAVVDAFIPHPTSSTTRHNLESKPRVQIPIRDRTSSTLLFLSLDPEPPSNRRRNNKKNSIDYYPENTPKQSPQELKLQSLEPNNIHQKNITISEEFMDPIMILPIATISTIVLLVLGVAYTFMTNPVMEFDIDFFMALDGVRDSTAGLSTGGMDSLDANTIVGLPKLSPAEQLVGALFGPN